MQHKDKYIWAMVGRFLPLAINLATTMILARYLIPADFGMIGVLSIFFVAANTLMDAGLGGSLIKEAQITPLDCSTIFVFNLVVSHLLYFLLFTSSETIEGYFEYIGLANVIKVLGLVFVINAWGLVPRSLLIRGLRFRAMAIINAVSAVVAAGVSIVFAIFNMGVYALVSYQIVSALLIVILSIYTNHFVISFHFSCASLRRLIPFGIFTTLTTVIDTIYENLITFLFGKYLNMQQAGFLSQAKRLEEIPSQTVAQTISSVAFPVLTQVRSNKQRFAKECKNTFKTVLLFTLPLLFIMSVFSEPIIGLVYGDQWQPAAPYLSMLVFAAIFHIVETLNRTFIKSTTEVAQLLSNTMIKRLIGIIVIFACLLVDTKYILMGYILSTAVGFIFNVYLLSKVSEITVWNQLKLFGVVLLPSVFFYLLMTIVVKHIEFLPLQIAIVTFWLMVYYLGVLQLYGIGLWHKTLQLLNKRVK